MIRIPNKDKKLIVDNFSTSYNRGNLYSTWNIMFDADKGRIKLNPPMEVAVSESTTGGSDFGFVNSLVVAQKNGGGGGEVYALTTTVAGFGGVWATETFAKLAGANAPSVARVGSSDMALYLGSGNSEKLYVSTTSGLHYIDPASSAGDWTLISTDTFKSKHILCPFFKTNRLYMASSIAIYSIDGSHTIATSGAYTIVGGLSNISCMRASSSRIWFAESATGVGKAKIYEWDGVSPNPTNIFPIDSHTIQSIVILNDIPYAFDDRGRLWKYDGYGFIIIDQIPYREDDYGQKTVAIHRNGTIADRGKIYVNVASNTSTRNTTERALSGIWCYDPEIGLYHFSSPANQSLMPSGTAGALSTGITGNTYCAGFLNYATAIDSFKYSLAKTAKTTNDGRIGHITTQLVESQNIDDLFDSVIVKHRPMVKSANEIEVKYRTSKGIECNALATWTSATTFTAEGITLDGAGNSGRPICTPVVVGDEVQVMNGANTGHIAIITSITGTTTRTVTIDRAASLTSGTSYVQINNYRLLDTISYNNVTQFKKVALGVPSTQLQVRLVLRGSDYYDEVQEIMIPEKKNEG